MKSLVYIYILPLLLHPGWNFRQSTVILTNKDFSQYIKLYSVPFRILHLQLFTVVKFVLILWLFAINVNLILCETPKRICEKPNLIWRAPWKTQCLLHFFRTLGTKTISPSKLQAMAIAFTIASRCASKVRLLLLMGLMIQIYISPKLLVSHFLKKK